MCLVGLKPVCEYGGSKGWWAGEFPDSYKGWNQGGADGSCGRKVFTQIDADAIGWQHIHDACSSLSTAKWPSLDRTKNWYHPEGGCAIGNCSINRPTYKPCNSCFFQTMNTASSSLCPTPTSLHGNIAGFCNSSAPPPPELVQSKLNRGRRVPEWL